MKPLPAFNPEHTRLLDSLPRHRYHSSIMGALIFIKDLLIATLGQIASLLAGIVVFGMVIHFFSQRMFRSLEKAFGENGVFFVAWLGTPIHELGHALFCLVFMHKIQEIEFFNPDPVTGSLGYVSHSWNRKNPWAVLGNLFIGIGPVILGCGVLFLAFYFLIPDSSTVWSTITDRITAVEKGYSFGSYLSVLGSAAWAMVKLIFTLDNITGWRFWVFFYLSICISSNVRLSPADLKHIFPGLGCIFVIFLLINLVGMLTGFGGETLFPFTASSMSIAYSLLILALVMVVLGFAVIYLLSALWYKLRGRGLLNPF